MKKTTFAILSSILTIIPLYAQKTNTIANNLTIYNDVLRNLDSYYVDTLNYDKLLENSVGYMLAQIDPYTIYIPKSETDDLRFMTTGEYGGIGSIITQQKDGVYISEPYEGMPAQRNGLKAGDRIIEIDGKSTKDKSLSDVSSMLKGKPNSKITVKVQRPNNKKHLTFTFTREKIQINPIIYSAVIAPHIGYIHLTEFTDNAAQEVKKTIQQLNQQDSLQSLIIDLCDNGGGIIDEAINIVGLFVPKGTVVVSTKGRTKSGNRQYKTTLEPLFPNLKLAILVNQNSASASEIVAGSIQDLDRGVIIGNRTFGKGLVQSIKPIAEDGHIKITTAKYYTPSGRCIQAIDYSNRNEDGSVGRVPDSLTHEFKTTKGRIVRDGGGITPDIEVKNDKNVSITYYLTIQHAFFNYATIYEQKHPNIDTPDKFELTKDDIADFENYLKEIDFTYKTETELALKKVEDLAKIEGLDSIAKQEFENLRQKLTPTLHQAIQDNIEDIKIELGCEIIKRYYFQKGSVKFLLRYDKGLQKAIEELQDEN